MALLQLSPRPVLRGSPLSNFVPALPTVAVLLTLAIHTTPLLMGLVVLASMLEGSCTVGTEDVEGSSGFSLDSLLFF